VRLYVKELVLKNFAGLPAEQSAERMIELSLYVQDNCVLSAALLNSGFLKC